MKKNYKSLMFIVLTVFLVLILAAGVSAIECGPTPTDGCKVTVDTIFDPGIYQMPTGLTIVANNTVLDCNGATLNGTQSGPTTKGIYTLRVNNIKVKNCILMNYVYGFSSDFMTNSLIQNNTFLNGNMGLRLGLSSDGNLLLNNWADNNTNDGFWIGISNNNQLSFNTATRNGNGGFDLYKTNFTVLTNNVAEDNERGFIFSDSDFNTLTNNIGSSNDEEGFWIISGSAYNVVSNNLANNNNGVNGVGFAVQSSSTSFNVLTSNIATGNTLYGFWSFIANDNEYIENVANNNSRGFEISASSNNLIARNEISDNTNVGIRIKNYGYFNSFENNYLDNVVNAEQLFDGNNTWKSNYWSDYSGSGSHVIGSIEDPSPVTVIDWDSDGVLTGADNCPWTDNFGQEDTDRDGIGDACEITDCGNGVLEEGEECDDGNLLNGDGCTSVCTIESCIPEPEVCDNLDNNCDGSIDEGFDADSDGITDCFDNCPNDAKNDEDKDGVCGNIDKCLGTKMPEGIPTEKLVPNSYAEIDNDLIFETAISGKKGAPNQIIDGKYSLANTYGCSCEQILKCKPGQTSGEYKNGCSEGTMSVWIKRDGWAKGCS